MSVFHVVAQENYRMHVQDVKSRQLFNEPTASLVDGFSDFWMRSIPNTDRGAEFSALLGSTRTGLAPKNLSASA
jgi:hypothetical protein